MQHVMNFMKKKEKKNYLMRQNVKEVMNCMQNKKVFFCAGIQTFCQLK
jgi:hypothetical protein